MHTNKSFGFIRVHSWLRCLEEIVMRQGLFVLLIAATIPASAATCEDLAKLALPSVSITTAESVPAGAFNPPGSPEIKGMPAFCRVAGSIKPTPDSDIQFEVWMPSSGWNGKFQGIGNGGFAGSITFGQMAGAVKSGYATAATDTGHHAGGTDGGWALGHPEKIVDFGHRAIPVTTETAKAIARAVSCA